MQALLNQRMNEPDNIEIIRDQLAFILKLELDNQYRLGVEAGDQVCDDYLVQVLVENDEPLSAGGDNDLFPLVNVSIENSQYGKGSASVNDQQSVATMYIDCYQEGNSGGVFAGRRASTKAWKLARCIRRILKADAYTYLRLRGVVSRVKITSMTAGVPNLADSAAKVVIVRITVEVAYNEQAERTTGPALELLPMKILDDNGQVLVE